MRTLDRLELLPNMGIELGFSTRAASVLNCLGIFPALVLWFFSMCLLFSFTFILYVCIFACMYVVCVPCICIFPKKIRNLVKMVVRHWGIKPGLWKSSLCSLLPSHLQFLSHFKYILFTHVTAFIVILMYFPVCLESIYENCR